MQANCFKRRHLGFVSGARLLGAVLLALTAPGARAQFAANNQTNVIDGTVVHYGAVYRVGNTHRGNVLIVTNGGLLSATGGRIGDNAAASNNLAVITGSGSSWTNGGNEFYVGNYGSRNRMEIGGGGQVSHGNGYLGYRTGSDGNSVMVSDPGSVWSNTVSYLQIGQGANNSLVITNGGAVHTPRWVYLGATSVNSTNNTIVISGPGSILHNKTAKNEGAFYAGHAGTRNRLTIVDGGILNGDNGYIGSGVGANDNVVIVTGAGSAWSNNVNFYPGSSGSRNLLVITNGGLVFSNTGNIGNSAGANSNTVVVTGSGSIWTNRGAVSVGVNGSFNQMTISEGGRVDAPGWSSVGGSNSGGTGSNNTVLATGAGSLWNLGNGRLYMRNANNRMTITNGAQLVNGGVNMTSTGNRATVVGAGSLWEAVGSYPDMYVGSGASLGNTLEIQSGGRIVSRAAYVGHEAAANGHVVTIDGPGSLWTNTSSVYVGNSGSGNRVSVMAGGTLAGGNSFIGGATGANDNLAVVGGSGSLWRVNGALTVGGAGRTGNALVMGAGAAAVVSGNVVVNGGGSVTNNVSGYSGGLDLTKSTATFTLSGTMAVNFVGDPRVTGLYWGFRRAGNHTNALQQLVNAGSLTVDDSGLAPFLQGKAGLHYDTTNSYVGLVVTRVPLPSERSTLVLIR